LSEGQGRDGVAYHFAAFLVRDLQLPDHEALNWLIRWDAGNLPPKGQERLVEILANAHAYGTNAYGSGLSWRPKHGSPSIRTRRSRKTKGSRIAVDL
jgi:hypothetical protein